jgi:hypothetical protein
MSEADAARNRWSSTGHQPTNLPDSSFVEPTPDWSIDLEGLSEDVAQDLDLLQNQSNLSQSNLSNATHAEGLRYESGPSFTVTSTSGKGSPSSQPTSRVSVRTASPQENRVASPKENRPTAIDLPLAEFQRLQTDRENLQAEHEQVLIWAAELERSLQETETALKLQLERSQRQETLISQRNQELIQSQHHMAALVQELEQAHQIGQRQQILIETLDTQLENSQERVAQMEREYTLTQKRFAEQTQRLVEAENECRDLKTRLSRQQRYTLQFKAALEKCLDVSVPGQPISFSDLAHVVESRDVEIEVDPTELKEEFFPRSQPVQPWSHRLDDPELEQEDADWDKVTQMLHNPLESLPPAAAPPADAVYLGIDPFSATPHSQTPHSQTPHSQTPHSQLSNLDLPQQEQQEEELSIPESEATPESTLEPIAESTPIEVIPTNVLKIEAEAEAEARSQLETEMESDVNGEFEFLDLDLGQKLEAVFETVEPAATENQMPSPSSSNLSSYQLWQDLARSTKLKTVSSFPLPPKEETVQETVTIELSLDTGSLDTRSLDTRSLDTGSLDTRSLDTEEAGSEPMVSDQPTAIEFPTHSQTEDLEEDLRSSLGVSLQSNWPAPLVYPLRSTQRRKSLAAIELPTFPKQSS